MMSIIRLALVIAAARALYIVHFLVCPLKPPGQAPVSN